MYVPCKLRYCGTIVRNIHVVRTIDEFRKIRSSAGLKQLGFVPTMGALHDGHVSLMERARRETDIVVASIFVNPTQFSAGEDLDKYPRTFDADMQIMDAAGVDFVFAPNLDEIYKRNTLCHVEPSDFSNISEGKARPDFFRGVATIVSKLFNIVQPSIAYFGQKDISQCILVKRMVEDLNFPVEIKISKTLRLPSGLAMSSRNTYLQPSEREVAGILYFALESARAKFDSADGGGIRREDLVKCVLDILQSKPEVTQVEYISVASHLDMKELPVIDSRGAVISSAIRLGSVRLIDNVLIGNASNDILGR